MREKPDLYKFIGECLVESLKETDIFEKFRAIDMARDSIIYSRPNLFGASAKSDYAVEFFDEKTYRAALEAIKIIWGMILECEGSGIKIWKR